jgi:RNA recognition motif-containing protein
MVESLEIKAKLHIKGNDFDEGFNGLLDVSGIFYQLKLPKEVQEDALKELFAKAGNVVSAVIIMDKMSGRSKGFGFVEMATDEEAQAAISMYNDQEYEGRKLTVNEARPMEARPPRTGGNGGYGGANRGGRREY